MVRYSENVCETVVAYQWDFLSFNIDVTVLGEELDSFSDWPVQVDKEILSDKDSIANSGRELIIAVEINAERGSEIAAVGEGGISWCGFFDRKGFARNGDFRSVGASESRGYLRLVIGCEEAQTVDVDVLAGVSSANGNDEVDVTRFWVALSDHAFADILAPSKSRDSIVPDRGALGGEDVFSEVISKNVKQVWSEPDVHFIRTALQIPAICVRLDFTFASGFVERPAASRWASI